MSYAICKQTFAPTGVEYCAQANITSEHEVNVIVAKTSLLQIYTLRASNSNAPLDLVYEQTLFGNIESVCPVRLPGAKRDSLVLSFRDAKVTIMEWDTISHGLRETSLHYFERPQLQDGHVRYRSRPVVRMDPKQRCAAMLVYDRRLAVLPFRVESSLLDEYEPTAHSSHDSMESYVINLAELGIRNVKDYTFLAGYYEPTVLILHEPLQTWTGRLPVRKETCVLTALQLNIAQRVQPVIWTVERLPHNSLQLVAVPEPLGGALVIGVNSLMYFNQSTRYSLALNEYAAQEPGSFQMEPLREDRGLISLDDSVCAFLNLDCLLLSLKGGELYLCQLLSDGRSLRNIEICLVSHDLLFLGSRLGDSLLIRFTQKSDKLKLNLNDIPSDDMEVTRPDKRAKLDDDDDVDMDMFDIDEGEHTNGKHTGPVQYSFSVCDSLVNIGPIVDSVLGESQDPASVSNSESSSARRNLELVTCSGHGKNGALCVMQRTIRPELTTAFELPGCIGMWTVYDAADKSSSEYHACLILSKPDSTMVLITGEELQEITDRVDLYVKGPTLTVGNVCGTERIVQVYARGVRLLAGIKKVLEFAPKRAITAATVLDPYVLLLLDGGSLHLLKANPDLLVPIEVPPLPGSGIVTSTFLFTDSSFFENTSRTYCGMVIDGDLYIYCLPDFQLVFHVSQLASAPLHLSNQPIPIIPPLLPTSPALPAATTITDPAVIEIAFHYIGSTSQSSNQPTLFIILDNGDVLIYRGFRHQSTTRFIKHDHGIITRIPADSEFRIDSRRSHIHKFDNIADYSGVFVAGYRPLWIFSERTFPRAHPMDIDGSVPCFTTFHNVNCPRGFIFINARGDLKICQLARHLNYEAPWPIRKVPLRTTPHRVAYHAEAKLYVAAVYDTIPVEPVVPVDPTNPVPPPPPSKGPHLPVAEDRSELRLLSPPSFDTLDRYALEQHEQVLALRLVMLRTENGGTVPYIVVGTGFLLGEDTACKGRVLIFDVQRQSSIVDEQTQEPKEKGEMRLAFSKDEKSPVSAVAQLEGFLMLAIGPKIIVYQFFDGQRLIGTAFFDAQLFIVSLNSVKNWVIVGDVLKSVYFLRWKEEGKSLTLLAKDFQHLQVYSTEYILEGPNLGIVVTDASKNLLLYSYSPQSLESRSGQMLLCRADFHVGAHIQKLIRIPVVGSTATSTPRHALVYGTLDGGVGYVRPLEESIFKKLSSLQSRLLTAMPHTAGLHPRAFRLAKPGRRSPRIHQKHILDGELLFKFLFLERPKQRELALAIGADPDSIITTIRDIDSSVAYL